MCAAASAPELSVVVIAFNEEDCLVPTVEELHQALTAAGIDYETVIVDDGSTDETAALADRLASRGPGVRALHQPNLGIGGALRTGFDATHGRFVTWVPADGQLAPDSVVELYQRRAEAPMLTTVYRTRDDPFFRTVISRSLNSLIRLRTGRRAKSGGNYLFERALWLAHGPRNDDSMMLSAAFRHNLCARGVPIVEVQIDCRARRAGHSKVLNPRVIWRTFVAATKMARVRVTPGQR